MINVIALVQLKAFARQDGALLGLVWIASFACIIYMPQSILGNLLALSTPFVVGWRLVAFRNVALDGRISFRRALAYCLYVFFYGSILFALGQFLYMQFLDHGTFMAMLSAAADELQRAYKQAGYDTSSFSASFAAFRSLSPILLAFSFMMQNLFIGALLSLPIAAIGKASPPTPLQRRGE